jgi:hypothetical protein
LRQERKNKNGDLMIDEGYEQNGLYEILEECGVPFDEDGYPIGIGD